MWEPSIGNWRCDLCSVRLFIWEYFFFIEVFGLWYYCIVSAKLHSTEIFHLTSRMHCCVKCFAEAIKNSSLLAGKLRACFVICLIRVSVLRTCQINPALSFPFPVWTFVIIVDFIQLLEFEAQASLALKYQRVKAYFDMWTVWSMLPCSTTFDKHLASKPIKLGQSCIETQSFSHRQQK